MTTTNQPQQERHTMKRVSYLDTFRSTPTTLRERVISARQAAEKAARHAEKLRKRAEQLYAELAETEKQQADAEAAHAAACATHARLREEYLASLDFSAIEADARKDFELQILPILAQSLHGLDDDTAQQIIRSAEERHISAYLDRVIDL